MVLYKGVRPKVAGSTTAGAMTFWGLRPLQMPSMAFSCTLVGMAQNILRPVPSGMRFAANGSQLLTSESMQPLKRTLSLQGRDRIFLLHTQRQEPAFCRQLYTIPIGYRWLPASILTMIHWR